MCRLHHGMERMMQHRCSSIQDPDGIVDWQKASLSVSLSAFQPWGLRHIVDLDDLAGLERQLIVLV